MLCLGIDTSGDWCSIALVDAAKILCMRTQKIGRGHGEVLASMVQDALASAVVKPSGISKISVCVGPGSFTGLRVGLSFARGFALPHKNPIVGLSALQIWAVSADYDLDKIGLAIADVRRGQVLSQTYQNGHALSEPELSDVDALIDRRKNLQYIVGSGAHLLDAVTSAKYSDQKHFGTTYVCPARLAWLGAQYTPDTRPANPMYHRPPDAKLPGGNIIQKGAS